jgi:hypothetical protein
VYGELTPPKNSATKSTSAFNVAAPPIRFYCHRFHLHRLYLCYEWFGIGGANATPS